MAKSAKIITIDHLTHDVLKVVAEKPAGLNYQPGQAADVSINKQGWENELRAFTFTSLPVDEHIEFTIKTYPSHNGVTNQLLSLVEGDELCIGEVFGDITYKGEGILIAGGAGITPFISILRQLHRENNLGNNKLLFANKTKADIIQENTLRKMLGENFINILSEENLTGYEHGFITAALISKYCRFNNEYYYLCGPPPMMKSIENQLYNLGIAEKYIVKEAF